VERAKPKEEPGDEPCVPISKKIRIQKYLNKTPKPTKSPQTVYVHILVIVGKYFCTAWPLASSRRVWWCLSHILVVGALHTFGSVVNPKP